MLLLAGRSQTQRMHHFRDQARIERSSMRPGRLEVPITDQFDYQIWLAARSRSLPECEDLRCDCATLPDNPIISVVMPVRDPPAPFLHEAIESVRAQIYPHWRFCLADDGSTRPDVRALLAEAVAGDPRIELVTLPESRGIVAASNAALALAQGEFVAFLDHDDALTPDALYEFALALNERPDADMIYSDEDKIDAEGKVSGPVFKPDWCPDSFLSRMYTCHLSAYRRELVVELGGLRPEYEGGQAYDLALRVSERARSIHHIPKVLYHWRMHAASTAADSGEKVYVYEADKRAIEAALARRGEPARVERVPGELGFYVARYALKGTPRISIIIPSRDHGGMLHRALDSIFSRTHYDNYEIIVVDNGSTEARARAVLADWSQREPERFRVAPLDIPFNFSTLCNHGVDRASGEILLFLNNDIEVIDGDWLSAMLEQAQRRSVGAVGARLFYEDGSIQHAGAILGLGGLAAHSHRGAPGASPGYMHQVWTINNYSSVAGACLMCRREVFDEAGRFDEELPGDYEDVDLCLKLVRKGYRNVYLPHVRLYHYEAATRGRDYVERDPEGRARAFHLMRTRWPDVIAHDPCYSPNLTRDREDYGLRIEGIAAVETRFQPSLLNFLACVDSAAVIDNRTLILRGWAVGWRGDAPASIAVAVDGEACGAAAYGYLREDVGNVHRCVLSDKVGFAFSCKFTKPLPPRIALRVTLSDAEGRQEGFEFAMDLAPPSSQGLTARWRRGVEAGAQKVAQGAAAVAAHWLPQPFEVGRLDASRLVSEVARRAALRFGGADALRRASAFAPALADRLGLDVPLTDDPAYADWLWRESPKGKQLAEMRLEAARFEYRPTISIFMPVYNMEEPYLRAAIDSALVQTYPYLELCIADDGSPGGHVRPLLEAYAAKDKRVKLTFRPGNGGISAASNSALALASGEFVAQLDHDDLLAPHALHRVVELLNVRRDADVIYSDEDKIDLGHLRSQPFFKPDWSPDTFRTKMYTCHFGVYRRALVEAVGGFRSQFDGAEDYDLVLRLTERTDRIFHIPDILYSWRMHPLSTASGSRDVKTYAYESGVRAVADALRRCGEPGEVSRVPGCLGFYRVRYDLLKPGPVTLVVPTRDSPRLLDRCLLSIFERTVYPDFEVVVLDNGGEDAAARSVIEKWLQREPRRFRAIRSDAPFNHSALVNAGARASGGDYLVLLNDDTEVIAPEWLEELARQAQRPGIGAVGAQLLYRDGGVQHAGIVVGVMGGAGHVERNTWSYHPGYFGRVNTTNNVLAVTGACLMCRRGVFESVGGFDEAFDSAYNDVDFCLRLHRLGLRNIYVPEAKLYHLESASFRRLPQAERDARVRRGAELMRERWPQYLRSDPYYSPHLTRSNENFTIG
jgi:GT2 family glycosyltransferase